MNRTIETVMAARSLSGVAAAMARVALEFMDAWSLAMRGDAELADPRNATLGAETLVSQCLNDAVGALNSSTA